MCLIQTSRNITVLTFIVATLTMLGCPPSSPTGLKAEFRASVTAGNAPLTVQFTDLSVPGASPITAWDWLFGDGGSSTEQDPVHTYTATGNYNVSLTVTTAEGQDTKLMLAYISVSATLPQPELSVTPSQREVSALAGTTSFSVSNSGTGTMNWSASVTSGSSWLRITSGLSGTNSGTVNIGCDASTGTSSRTGTVQVTAPGATGSPISVTVVQAAPAAQPVLSVTPSEREVSALAGTTSFSVSNSGTGTMNWSASVTSGSSWLRITSGSTGTNSGTVNIGCDANTGTSSRTGTVQVTAPGATGNPKTVSVVQAPTEAIEETILLPGGVALEMVWIPGGTFLMGRYPGEQWSDWNEDPRHQVTVPGFWMGKYEVTQAQWQAVMGSNPSYFVGANRPVESVSWNMAQDFIVALNAATGRDFRLPSEAEWEYATRAGTATRFYWGDDPNYSQIGNYVWYHENSGSQTHNVGLKLPNAFGLYDMSGNVWEWVQDWYHSSYTGAPNDGSAWESPTGSYRVWRGGSWNRYRGDCRSAGRYYSGPSYASDRSGFRLSR